MPRELVSWAPCCMLVTRAVLMCKRGRFVQYIATIVEFGKRYPLEPEREKCKIHDTYYGIPVGYRATTRVLGQGRLPGKIVHPR